MRLLFRVLISRHKLQLVCLASCVIHRARDVTDNGGFGIGTFDVVNHSPFWEAMSCSASSCLALYRILRFSTRGRLGFVLTKSIQSIPSNPVPSKSLLIIYLLRLPYQVVSSPSSFSIKIFLNLYALNSPCVPRVQHPSIIMNLIIVTISGKRQRLYYFVQPHFTASPILCPLNVRNNFWLPYENWGKIIVPYIGIFILSDNRR